MVKPSGDSNREAWFLSAQEGVIKATVFGGPKSKLRSQAAPFNQGKLYIYHDPVRDSNKVIDFDVQLWRPGLREMYERIMAANSLAETVLATHAGGSSYGTALELASGALDCLETADEKTCQRILLQFFWAWTELLGVKPDLNHCSVCACDIKSDEILCYSPAESNPVCAKCLAINSAGHLGRVSEITVGPGARRWLAAVENAGPKNALKFNLDTVSFDQARSLVLSVLTESVGRRLPLWDY